jgi:dienelactone hydrolase
LYARWIDDWERRLATRDTNRVARPFEWGTEWLGGEGGAAFLDGYVTAALEDSAAYFSYAAVKDYSLRGDRLTFTSPVESPYPENNTVNALWHPARRDRSRALVVLPQWNAGPDGHGGLCRLLNRFGVSALRMTMAYHAERMPAGLQRAEYHVSSNIGRTIHATRQSIVDTRACLDWLAARGYQRLGVLGTSLGSCVAFIAAAHDERVRAGIFNHVSMYFGDVAWTGLSTRHVRASFGEAVTQDQLRRYWAPISPAAYFDRMASRKIPSLVVWATHDTSFLPVYSRQVLERFASLGIPHRVLTLPCGHYTTGQFPFKLLDGLAMCRFAATRL